MSIATFHPRNPCGRDSIPALQMRLGGIKILAPLVELHLEPSMSRVTPGGPVKVLWIQGLVTERSVALGLHFKQIPLANARRRGWSGCIWIPITKCLIGERQQSE